MIFTSKQLHVVRIEAGCGGPGPHPLGKQAFSLIELLAVIAIIGVLCGMIYPVYTGVRTKMDASTCAANLRQIGTSGAMFTAEHGGLMYYERYQPQVSGVLFRNIDTSPDPDSSSSWLVDLSGWFWDYNGTIDPVVCPELHDGADSSIADRSSYTASTRCVTVQQAARCPYQGARHQDSGLVYANEIKNPAAAFTFACRAGKPAVGAKSWKDASPYGNSDYNIGFFHDGKANFLFADGHVEALTPEEVLEREDKLFDLE